MYIWMIIDDICENSSSVRTKAYAVFCKSFYPPWFEYETLIPFFQTVFKKSICNFIVFNSLMFPTDFKCMKRFFLVSTTQNWEIAPRPDDVITRKCRIVGFNTISIKRQHRKDILCRSTLGKSERTHKLWFDNTLVDSLHTFIILIFTRV